LTLHVLFPVVGHRRDLQQRCS